MRCIPIWSGCCLISLTGRWLRKAHCFCLQNTNQSRMQLFTVGQVGTGNYFGIKHFHEYIYGRPFMILTDHKPLLCLLSKSKATSPMASARLQHWSLLLGAYQYCIQYKAGPAHANADALSRLPLLSCPTPVPLPSETIKLMEHLDSIPVTVSRIRTLTSRDPLLRSSGLCNMDGLNLPSQS